MTGFKSKRAAARDKLEDDDALTIAYQSGYYDGKKAAQPAQEPVATLFGTLPVYDNTPPQLAQEREALKLALKVLENLPGFRADIDNAITVIKEVLEKTHEN